MTLFLDIHNGAFLVAALLVYWLVLKDRNHRMMLVTGGSMAIIFRIHPLFFWIMVGAALGTYAISRSISRGQEGRGAVFFLFIISAVAYLLLAKYIRVIYSGIFGGGDWVTQFLVVPLGVSYFTFKMMQFIFDCYRGAIKNPTLLELFTFLFFIPILPAGPIETFQGFVGKKSEGFRSDFITRGLQRILSGYFKKIVLVDYVLKSAVIPPMAANIDSMSYSSGSGKIFIAAFLATALIHAYIDLSAYTDLAIGYSRLFGYDICENFNRPFFSRNLGEFWRRWHMSLSGWCRDNVYFPVFGITRKPWLAMYCSMLTMGLWHEISLNWFCWGLFHGSGLVFVLYWERYKRKRKALKRILRRPIFSFIATVITFWYVAWGFSFVAFQDFSKALRVFFGVFAW
jgi:alginate O-acetyltransferase complex protein AlgI